MDEEQVEDENEEEFSSEEIEEKGELVFENCHSIGPLAADDVRRIYKYEGVFWSDGGYDGEWNGPYNSIKEAFEENDYFLSIAPVSADVTILTKELPPASLAELLTVSDGEWDGEDEDEDVDDDESGEEESDEQEDDEEGDDELSFTINDQVWEIAPNGKLRRSE